MFGTIPDSYFGDSNGLGEDHYFLSLTLFGNNLDRARDDPTGNGGENYHKAYLHGLPYTSALVYGQDDLTPPVLTGSSDVSGTVITFFDVDAVRDENSYAVSYGTDGTDGT